MSSFRKQREVIVREERGIVVLVWNGGEIIVLHAMISLVYAQTADFNQSRDFSQNQFRMEQPRETDTISGQFRDVGDAIKHTKTISGSEDQTVNVSAGSWADDGAHYECAIWTPDVSTVDYGTDFTQTRSCKKE